MSAPYDDDHEFDRIIQGFTVPAEPVRHNIDPNPYGVPGEYAQPVKPGLTKRGKAALGIGAAVFAGGTLIGYQVYSSNVAESEAKAQELKVQSQQLELEKLREMNKASQAASTQAVNTQKAIQASVDACVKSHADSAKFGTPMYSVIVSDCQNQYASTTSGSDMQAAASSTSQGSSGGGGITSSGLLVGGAALAVVLVVAANKGRRADTA